MEPPRAHQRALIDLIRVTEDRSGAFFRDDDYLLTVWNAFFAAGAGQALLRLLRGPAHRRRLREHVRRDRPLQGRRLACGTVA